MHAWILGVALAATLGMAFAATDDKAGATSMPCPRAHAPVLERFISAECEACWTDASVAQPGSNEWLLDWIVPSARGDEAPLSSAAPAEAAARARRVLKAEPASDRASVQRSAARTEAGWQLRVSSGPAWSGYFGVQVDASGRANAGAAAWVALVETVAAGTDGSAVPRQLVRTLSGPFTSVELRSGKPWRHLQAMRWPETAKPARLHARAWIEDAAGRIVAMAGEPCAAAR
ncbi:MAG TPA: hypothetical protein VI032_11150 [Burkholderiaceae bacterium]